MSMAEILLIFLVGGAWSEAPQMGYQVRGRTVPWCWFTNQRQQPLLPRLCAGSCAWLAATLGARWSLSGLSRRLKVLFLGQMLWQIGLRARGSVQSQIDLA